MLLSPSRVWDATVRCKAPIAVLHFAIRTSTFAIVQPPHTRGYTRSNSSSRFGLRLAQRLRPLAATTITTSGTVNLPAFFEPLAAYRVVLTRRRRTKVDGAECGREVIDEHFLDASVVLLVMDNLNIHHLSSSTKRSAPPKREDSPRARRVTTRRSTEAG